MRPWIKTPAWDGKVVLGALFTGGYFFIIYILVGPDRGDLSETQKDIATIALAALGPQLGQIYGSIFRTTAADERDADRRTDALKTAIETPSTPSTPSLGDQVENGAERGARRGVTDGLSAADERTNETDDSEELPEYAR